MSANSGEVSRVGRPCTICGHSEREAIESAYWQGETQKQLSREFADVSEDALQRHFSNHAAPVVRRALPGLPALQLVERVQAIADRARDAATASYADERIADGTRADLAELKALTVLSSRLGIDDDSMAAEVREVEALISAVGTAAREHPEIGDHIVRLLRTQGATIFADALSQNYESKDAS